MNWNEKPESVTLPPPYPKSQASFLHQPLINPLNSVSQSSFNYAGSKQEACMYSINSNPISQPVHNIRNYKTQQIPVSEMHDETVVASQTSVERITYTNVKGHKQLNHNLHTSSGVTENAWMNSTTRNPLLSHTGITVSNQAGFGDNMPNIHALQNQFVTSGTYSMELQIAPSNSVRVPVTYQGNQRFNPSFSEQQVEWAQKYTSDGLTFPRPLPNQYCFSQQSYLQDPTIQKQNPMASTSLQVKNNQFPNPALSLRLQQNATLQSHQYAFTQTDSRRLPSYDCQYASQPLQSTQHVVKHLAVEVPWNQETHLPKKKRENFYRGFQQQWRTPNEKVSMVGNSCNMKENANIRSSVDGVQRLAQNNQDKRIDSCNPTSNQVLDTNVTKENLVKDIKALVEMKRKFSELAMKIKIKKDLLMAAGCHKTSNTPRSESVQNSELSLKQSAKMQCGPQATPVTLEISEDKPQRVMESAEKTNKTHCTWTSNIQEINCRKFNQVNSILPNSFCSEKLPMPDRFNDLKVSPSLKAPVVDTTQTTLNNTEFSSENFVRGEQNWPTNSETISCSQSTPFEECTLKHPNKNPLLLKLLESEDKTPKKFLKDASEIIRDSKPNCFEMNQRTQITGNERNLKTMESTSDINGKVSDNSFGLDHQSSTNGMSCKTDNRCSMELLATCLSLWKKQPSELTEEKLCKESGINTIAVGKPKPVEVICGKSPWAVVGNSQNKTIKSSQETASSAVVQNYESSGTNTTKGPELQVAVVPPLILLDVNTLSVKGLTPEALPETVYPVIKEGSVCSLQDQLAENTTLTGSLKADADGPVASTTSSTKIFPLTQKEKQNELTNDNSEGSPNASQGKHIKSEPDVHSLASTDTSVCLDLSDNQQVLCKDSTPVSDGDMLQIASICSLVESDTSYNSQIAKMFDSPPLKKVEPQKLALSNHQVINSGQEKEQFDKNIENKDFDFQKEKFVQSIHVSPKIADLAKSLQSPESSALKCVDANRSIQVEHKMEFIIKKEITSVCSLVESDTSYNSQIAKMFDSRPLKKVEPQKLSLSNHQVINSGQEKEQLDKITEKDFDFQKEKLVQSTHASPKIADLSKSLQPPESSSLKYVDVNKGIQAEHNLECVVKNKSRTTDRCYSLPTLQKEIYLQNTDASYNYILQDPIGNEISSDKTSDVYLCDQLSELLKEFPYGIEAVNTHDGSVGQQTTDQISKKAETTDKTSCDSKGSTDQIQITILSSEQMKELFPEQDEQPRDTEIPATSQMEKPVTKVGSQSDPQAQTEGESCDSVLPDSEKDDIHCCALGWLSMIYEGVPQCQCNATETSPSEKEKKEDQCSSLETNSCKAETTSNRGVPTVEHTSTPNNNLRFPLTHLDKKKHFPATEQSKNTKDKFRTKHSSVRIEQELSGQSLSKSDKKLDSFPHPQKRKQKLKFHEVTFNSSNKMMKFYDQHSQESLQRKHTAQIVHPLKPKTALMANKDLHGKNKNGSSKQSILPEKIKFKVDVSRYKLLKKRKLDLGATVDSEIKKKKLDKQEQNENVGSTSKLCNTLSNPSEKTSIKEKTVSLEVKITNLEINVPKNLMKSSNANTKSSDLKDVSCKINRVVISKECLQRQKHKEVMGNKAPKNSCVIEKMKNIAIDSEYMKPSKLSKQIETCGKSNERNSSSAQTAKESLNLNHVKNLKTHLAEDSKIHTSRNVKGKVVGKQPDKKCLDKTKLDKNLTSINNEAKFNQMCHQTKNQGKPYLNRVAFKCTERQSLYLTKLDDSPRKLNQDKKKSREEKSKSVLPLKDTTEKPGMLQFKLCPEGLLNDTNQVEEQKDLKLCPRKEQAPVQGPV
ncbi:retroelement silencing factor 1 isoform X2 [Choloepus didactylus]|uniref:retroelement silencing factor 1 isoform X2 n=1 Tax=Choloepus didactylus TaxID=27675 RepID=UPI00189CC6DE|nr:retroelement silencing factor 1 isoform X2 [Choloepus didactylus]